MIIKGLSAFSTEAGNAPTTANYPALKHLWQCNEPTTADGADTVVTDVVGGVTVGGLTTAEIVNNADYTITITQNGGKTVKSGTLATVAAGKCPVIICIGKMAANADIDVGDIQSGAITHGITPNTTKKGIRIDCGATAARLHDGAESFAGNTTARVGDGAWAGYALSLDYVANGMKTHDYDAATGVANSSAGTTLNTGGDGTATAASAIPIDNFDAFVGFPASCAMLAIFYFDDVPTDIKSALAWMVDNIEATGEKVIYPGWIGRN